jgi:hypothetical protein
MGEWLLSRRDRLIVARHEAPGLPCREGAVPDGRGYFPRDSRHFVLGFFGLEASPWANQGTNLFTTPVLPDQSRGAPLKKATDQKTYQDNPNNDRHFVY